MSPAPPSSDLLEERLLEACLMSAVPTSSDLTEDRLVETSLVSSASSHLLLVLGSSALMEKARLLLTILGLSSSRPTEVMHSTTETGEGDLFFFGFSPLCSRGLLDLSLLTEV